MRARLVLAVAAVGLVAAVVPAGADPVQPPPVVLPVVVPVVAAGQPVPGNMAYYGGDVLTHPHVYLDFWGWRDDRTGARARLIAFFKGIGGSAYESVVTQYYEEVDGRRARITNPRNQLSGVWDDRRAPHAGTLSEDAVEAEALRAAGHFGTRSDPDAVVLVATPPYASTDYAAGGYCAYHGYSDGVAFINLPFVVTTSRCGAGQVNKPGLLDGVTIVAGHEYLEAITDPTYGLPGTRAGWHDLDRLENADKCAWTSIGPGAMKNVTLSTGTFPVQGTWSNADLGGLGACSTG